MNRLFRLCLVPAAAALMLAACSTPVEFSASANPPPWNDTGDADFSGMDNSMSACKAVAKKPAQAAARRCAPTRRA